MESRGIRGVGLDEGWQESPAVGPVEGKGKLGVQRELFQERGAQQR